MKRQFYADDETTLTTPGLNKPISDELKQKESLHGNISFIDGMGIRSVPALEKYSNQVRLWLHDHLLVASAELNTQTTAVRNEWNSLKTEFRSVVVEPVLPNSIYILTAALTGSIVANRRLLPVRFVSPLLFGGVAFSYLMPASYANAKAKFIDFEKQKYPDVYKQQVELGQQWKEVESAAVKVTKDVEVELQNSVHNAKEWVVELLKD